MARTDCFPTQMNHLFLVSPPSGLETDSVLDSLANLGMGVWCKDQDKWFPRFSPHQLPYWFWVPNGLSKSAPLPMPMCSEPFLARTHGVICALQLTIDSLTSKKSELQAKRDQIAILRVCAFYICIFYFFLFFLFLLFFSFFLFLCETTSLKPHLPAAACHAGCARQRNLVAGMHSGGPVSPAAHGEPYQGHCQDQQAGVAMAACVLHGTYLSHSHDCSSNRRPACASWGPWIPFSTTAPGMASTQLRFVIGFFYRVINLDFFLFFLFDPPRTIMIVKNMFF